MYYTLLQMWIPLERDDRHPLLFCYSPAPIHGLWISQSEIIQMFKMVSALGFILKPSNQIIKSDER